MNDECIITNETVARAVALTDDMMFSILESLEYHSDEFDRRVIRLPLGWILVRPAKPPPEK